MKDFISSVKEKYNNLSSNKKIITIVLFVIILFSVFSFSTLIVFTNNTGSTSNLRSQSAKKKNKISDNNIKSSKIDPEDEQNDSSSKSNSSSAVSTKDNDEINSNTSAEVSSNTGSNAISSSSSTNGTSSSSQPAQSQPQTPWDRLGISEYDYYNTPADNEGELAFKGSTSLCQNEIDRLTDLYYDNGIDGGRYYTVNSKYTHSYLGCGIYIIMNGRQYTYSQIKAMGFK